MWHCNTRAFAKFRILRLLYFEIENRRSRFQMYHCLHIPITLLTRLLTSSGSVTRRLYGCNIYRLCKWSPFYAAAEVAFPAVADAVIALTFFHRERTLCINLHLSVCLSVCRAHKKFCCQTTLTMPRNLLDYQKLNKKTYLFDIASN